MSTTILALLDDEQIADQVAKAISNLNHDDVSWEFINHSSEDTRLMAGIPTRSGTDMARPMGFIQETDAPASISLDGLDLSDAEKRFYAQGLEGNAILIRVDAPDDAIDQVEGILVEHNAGRFTEA